MKLIVGLGNPGDLYKDSRHNIGFSIVKALSRAHKTPFKKDRNTFSLSAKAKINNEQVILALPVTFVNLSGLAVSALLKKYRVGLEGLLVVSDDLDIEFGRLKLRPAGSSGGHQGLQSLIDTLGSQKFARLRIGLGRPKDRDTAEYVLSHFTKKEKERLKQVIAKACLCCRFWLREGISKSMNIFNRRNQDA
jgi:PTH1 family peptidyl-tRNA hydrolase